MEEAQELVNLITTIISRPNTRPNTRPGTPTDVDIEIGQSTSQPQPQYRDYARPSKFAVQISRSVGTQTNTAVDQYQQYFTKIQNIQFRKLIELNGTYSVFSNNILNKISRVEQNLESQSCRTTWIIVSIWICMFFVVGLIIFDILVDKEIA